jgi:hypothetical protein
VTVVLKYEEQSMVPCLVTKAAPSMAVGSFSKCSACNLELLFLHLEENYLHCIRLLLLGCRDTYGPQKQCNGVEVQHSFDVKIVSKKSMKDRCVC